MNERLPRDQEDSGSIGIGAMIVFIALILVAAVASTIIIKTAEELQQNAEQTSSDTRQQISGKVAITDLIVATVADDIGAGSHVATFDVVWRVSSGSTGIYPADVSYYITCDLSDHTGTGLGFDDGDLPAYSIITETVIADDTELTAGNTYYTTVTLTNADVDSSASRSASGESKSSAWTLRQGSPSKVTRMARRVIRLLFSSSASSCSGLRRKCREGEFL